MDIRRKHVLVTGGAGFIGSHLVDSLVSLENKVKVYDNLSTGRIEFLADSFKKVDFVKGDLLDRKTLEQALGEVDFVFHMAAHADVRENLKHPETVLQQNITATVNVLEAMRRNGVKGIALPSTGSVYGEPDIHPTPENAPFPVQTSVYGASKLAGEGLLQAYAAGYGFNSFIFRFVSFMGERYTHGCIIDFMRKLRKDPNHLEILGDGRQKKSYLYVKDGIQAMLTAIKASKDSLNIYNLGHDECVGVTPIAKTVCDELGLRDVQFKYTGGERGWIGDSPYIHLDISRIKALGWKPTLSTEDCVRRTVRWLKGHPELFDEK